MSAPIYTCRRCHPAVPLSTYNMLRAHLRAHHRIVELANSDVSLYETYPGSRFEQLPFSQQRENVGPVDQMIVLRNELIAAVNDAIASSLANIRPPLVSNTGEMIAAINGLRAEQAKSVAALTAGMDTIRTTLMDLVRVLEQQLTEPANTDAQINDVVGVNPTETPDETRIRPEIIPIDQNDPVVPSPIDVLQSGEPNAQSTQLSAVGEQQTNSDEELMRVALPEETVTVSQIIAEMREQVIKIYF